MKIEAIKQLTDAQIEDLYRLYQNQWWSKGRKKEDIVRTLQHSDIIVAFCDPQSKRLIAFSRILTDYIYRAVVFDVIVEASYQGSGLGRLLMDAIVHHSALKSVEELELFCRPDMVAFYHKWGFCDRNGELHIMSKKQFTAE